MPIIEMGEKTVYFPDDMSEEEVQAVVDRDISRAVNIGELFKGMDTQDYLDAAAITTSPIPVVGDVAGLVADVNMYATDPESRNWFNYLFSAAGVLPFVPAPSAVRKTAEKVQKYADNSRNKKRATVKDAARVAYPGVYKDPRKIIADVEVAPESENLGKIFNTSREELADIANRQGNIDPVLPGQAVNPKGSAAAQNVMTPRNEQRLLDLLDEARKNEGLFTGMKGWYVLDPAYNRLAEMYGPEKAAEMFERMNTLTGMASPMSDVATEINRGTAANTLFNQGRFDDFMRYGGLKQTDKPVDMQMIKGHTAHSTSQAPPMRDYLESGEVRLKSPKVPMYIQASSVPEVGFQTQIPVGDAHWSRAVGLADTRFPNEPRGRWLKKQGKWEFPGESVSTPEMTDLGPWWRENVAAEAGLESVPAQAITWGAMGKQTGVKTPVGAPKLEILADQIDAAARREGVDPLKMRDDILSGKKIAGNVDPELLAWLLAGGVGALAAPAFIEDNDAL